MVKAEEAVSGLGGAAHPRFVRV